MKTPERAIAGYLAIGVRILAGPLSFFKKYLQAVYSIWAKVYDRYVDSIFSFDRKKVIVAAKVKKGERVLEVGVGTGLNLPYYPKNCTVYGVDFSKAMLAKAKQKKVKAKVVLKQMDVSKMSFSAKFFDKAVMTYVLRVAPEPQKMLREISRVLKPKGTIVILDQFKVQNSLLLMLMKPVKLLLGWGKDPNLDQLLKGVPLQIRSRKRFGMMKGTQLCILQKR